MGIHGKVSVARLGGSCMGGLCGKKPGTGLACVGHSLFPEAKAESISKASEASMKMCFDRDRKQYGGKRREQKV